MLEPKELVYEIDKSELETVKALYLSSLTNEIIDTDKIKWLNEFQPLLNTSLPQITSCQLINKLLKLKLNQKKCELGLFKPGQLNEFKDEQFDQVWNEIYQQLSEDPSIDDEDRHEFIQLKLFDINELVDAAVKIVKLKYEKLRRNLIPFDESIVFYNGRKKIKKKKFETAEEFIKHVLINLRDIGIIEKDILRFLEDYLNPSCLLAVINVCENNLRSCQLIDDKRMQSSYEISTSYNQVSREVIIHCEILHKKLNRIGKEEWNPKKHLLRERHCARSSTEIRIQRNDCNNIEESKNGFLSNHENFSVEIDKASLEIYDDQRLKHYVIIKHEFIVNKIREGRKLTSNDWLIIRKYIYFLKTSKNELNSKMYDRDNLFMLAWNNLSNAEEILGKDYTLAKNFFSNPNSVNDLKILKERYIYHASFEKLCDTYFLLINLVKTQDWKKIIACLRNESREMMLAAILTAHSSKEMENVFRQTDILSLLDSVTLTCFALKNESSGMRLLSRSPVMRLKTWFKSFFGLDDMIVCPSYRFEPLQLKQIAQKHKSIWHTYFDESQDWLRVISMGRNYRSALSHEDIRDFYYDSKLLNSNSINLKQKFLVAMRNNIGIYQLFTNYPDAWICFHQELSEKDLYNLYVSKLNIQDNIYPPDIKGYVENAWADTGSVNQTCRIPRNISEERKDIIRQAIITVICHRKRFDVVEELLLCKNHPSATESLYRKMQYALLNNRAILYYLLNKETFISRVGEQTELCKMIINILKDTVYSNGDEKKIYDNALIQIYRSIIQPDFIKMFKNQGESHYLVRRWIIDDDFYVNFFEIFKLTSRNISNFSDEIIVILKNVHGSFLLGLFVRRQHDFADRMLGNPFVIEKILHDLNAEELALLISIRPKLVETIKELGLFDKYVNKIVKAIMLALPTISRNNIEKFYNANSSLYEFLSNLEKKMGGDLQNRKNNKNLFSSLKKIDASSQVGLVIRNINNLSFVKEIFSSNRFVDKIFKETTPNDIVKILQKIFSDLKDNNEYVELAVSILNTYLIFAIIDNTLAEKILKNVELKYYLNQYADVTLIINLIAINYGRNNVDLLSFKKVFNKMFQTPDLFRQHHQRMSELNIPDYNEMVISRVVYDMCRPGVRPVGELLKVPHDFVDILKRGNSSSIDIAHLLIHQYKQPVAEDIRKILIQHADIRYFVFDRPENSATPDQIVDIFKLEYEQWVKKNKNITETFLIEIFSDHLLDHLLENASTKRLELFISTVEDLLLQKELVEIFNQQQPSVFQKMLSIKKKLVWFFLSRDFVRQKIVVSEKIFDFLISESVEIINITKEEFCGLILLILNEDSLSEGIVKILLNNLEKIASQFLISESDPNFIADLYIILCKKDNSSDIKSALYKKMMASNTFFIKVLNQNIVAEKLALILEIMLGNFNTTNTHLKEHLESFFASDSFDFDTFLNVISVEKLAKLYEKDSMGKFREYISHSGNIYLDRILQYANEEQLENLIRNEDVNNYLINRIIIHIEQDSDILKYIINTISNADINRKNNLLVLIFQKLSISARIKLISKNTQLLFKLIAQVSSKLSPISSENTTDYLSAIFKYADEFNLIQCLNLIEVRNKISGYISSCVIGGRESKEALVLRILGSSPDPKGEGLLSGILKNISAEYLIFLCENEAIKIKLFEQFLLTPTLFEDLYKEEMGKKNILKEAPDDFNHDVEQFFLELEKLEPSPNIPTIINDLIDRYLRNMYNNYISNDYVSSIFELAPEPRKLYIVINQKLPHSPIISLIQHRFLERKNKMWIKFSDNKKILIENLKIRFQAMKRSDEKWFNWLESIVEEKIRQFYKEVEDRLDFFKTMVVKATPEELTQLVKCEKGDEKIMKDIILGNPEYLCRMFDCIEKIDDEILHDDTVYKILEEDVGVRSKFIKSYVHASSFEYYDNTADQAPLVGIVRYNSNKQPASIGHCLMYLHAHFLEHIEKLKTCNQTDIYSFTYNLLCEFLFINRDGFVRFQYSNHSKTNLPPMYVRLFYDLYAHHFYSNKQNFKNISLRDDFRALRGKIIETINIDGGKMTFNRNKIYFSLSDNLVYLNTISVYYKCMFYHCYMLNSLMEFAKFLKEPLFQSDFLDCLTFNDKEITFKDSLVNVPDCFRSMVFYAFGLFFDERAKSIFEKTPSLKEEFINALDELNEKGIDINACKSAVDQVKNLQHLSNNGQAKTSRSKFFSGFQGEDKKSKRDLRKTLSMYQ